MTSDSVQALIGKSLRSRAQLVTALCAIAEDEFRSGDRLRAGATVSTIRKVLADITTLLDGDTSQIPLTDLRMTTEALAGLEARLQEIETVAGALPIQ